MKPQPMNLTQGLDFSIEVFFFFVRFFFMSCSAGAEINVYIVSFNKKDLREYLERFRLKCCCY